MKLGHANVDRLARSITAKQLFEWEHYATLEPFNEIRDDYRFASIAHSLHELMRVTIMMGLAKESQHLVPKSLTLKDFVIKFGEQDEEEKPKTELWQTQMMWAKALTRMQNEIEDSKQRVLEPK